GDFSGYRLTDNDRGYDLATAIAWLRERLPNSTPILTGLPFGHCPEKLTLPVGAQANLTANLLGFTLQAQW
ncbi:MAG: LD-carboxypeptidase, partial [Burkholderiaceae bacterium]|nr:LD-carboxypeptidase [Burkholderiaceae bacterium]